jgi:quercetin dioxygenase-like cupin family protein
MTDQTDTAVEFDEIVAMALAELAPSAAPRPAVRGQLMARLGVGAPEAAGFVFRMALDDDWLPHPVPGIRMKVLGMNRRAGYATLLLDVAPGTRFPEHHHDGDEECYVLSGSVNTLGRRLGPGDFLHANAGTHHHELWTDEGAQVLLVVPPEDFMPDPPR